MSVVTPAAKASIFRPLTFSRNKVTKAVEGTPSFTGFSVSSPTNKDVELGRQAFLEDVSSPWYRERWINAGVHETATDRVLADMYKQAEAASFDLSKNTKQLGSNYGLTIKNLKR